MRETTGKIRVAIVDDHTMLRQGLCKILAMEEDLEVVGDTDKAEEAADLAARTRPDVLLLDIRMPGTGGLEVIGAIHEASPTTKILILTASDDRRDHVAALSQGARGIIMKDSAAETLVTAIRAVHEGQAWVDREITGTLLEELAHRGHPSEGQPQGPQLTAREAEIVDLVIAGCRNREISERLSISEKTVKAHLSNIFAKLGVRDRLELAIYALNRRS
ncbi:MAG: DNA-binding response regulator [Candidatus Dadabacteria bacterium]|nr:MAG: DNA-binding response regulator [Candidatus Dadabacteria bacterium]